MREIKNNVEISKAQDVKVGNVEKNEAVVNPNAEEIKEIKDLSNPQADASGRVQVSKPDNIKQDINFGMNNPEVMSKSDKLFEMAFKSLQADNDPEAYEKACAIATSNDARELFVK